MTERTIKLKTSESYDVIVGKGILKTCGDRLKSFSKAKKIAVITDDNVDPIYGGETEKSFSEAGFEVCKYVFPHGEESKTLNTLERILSFLAQNHVTRSDCIAALGGGVTGDMAGFAAAVYLRGIDFIQIPTSLLAQVDSSVGGKTAVNLCEGKNLVGAFKQPELVICDTETLKTLPEYYLIDGFGEVIKHAMIKSEKLFEILEKRNIKNISDILDDIIYENIVIKSGVVGADEFEKGERMLLNFGHTFAHSIEKFHNYGGISHGRAVAAGALIITKIFEEKGVTDRGTYDRLKNCFSGYGLDRATEIPPVKELVADCLSDKKRRGDTMNLAVCKRPGASFIYKISVNEFAEFKNLNINL